MYNGGDAGAGDARADAAARERRILRGLEKIDQKFAGFDQGFYDQRAKAYEDYALPELAGQYDTAKRGLAYAMANRGLLNSGAMDRESANLARLAEQQKQTVADTGIGQANELRTNIANDRSQLVSQLEASANPAEIGSLAQARAAQYQAPSSFGPVGQFFADWTNNYLTNLRARAVDSSVPNMFSWGNKGAASSYVG